MKSNKSSREETEYQEPSHDYQILKQQYQNLWEKNRELEQAKKKAESSIVIQSEFLANMSHDLRTPLHAILSYSRFGIEKIERVTTEKIIKYFSSIEVSGKKLQYMLNQIVDLSKLESGKMIFQMYHINLSLVITSVLNNLREDIDRKQIKIETNIPEKTSSLLCDQNKINQVMSTLLTSAIHHSPEGETVSISIEECQLEENPLKSGIKVSFNDRRLEPIPQEMIEDFDTFIDKERVKTGSRVNGIVLAIAFEIIKYHHGKMKVRNCPDGGVSFSVTLPLTQPEPQES